MNTPRKAKAAIRVRDIDHVVLRVKDVPKAIRFYCEALGGSVDRERADLGLYHLRLGSRFIDLVDVAGKLGRPGGAAPRAKGRNMDHLCLNLESFDEANIRTYLATHGIEAGEVVERYGAEGDGPSLYIRDPEGNTIELKGPPKRRRR